MISKEKVNLNITTIHGENIHGVTDCVTIKKYLQDTAKAFNKGVFLGWTVTFGCMIVTKIICDWVIK